MVSGYIEADDDPTQREIQTDDKKRQSFTTAGMLVGLEVLWFGGLEVWRFGGFRVWGGLKLSEYIYMPRGQGTRRIIELRNEGEHVSKKL